MKQLTVKEYYALLNSEELKNASMIYWEIKTSTKTEYKWEHRASTSEKMYEFGEDVQVEEKIEVTCFTLKLKEFLTSKGYAAVIYPIQEPELHANHSISKEGCVDLFETTTFNETLLADLKWCLEDYSRLPRSTIRNILENYLTKEQLKQLYQDNIDKFCKDMIFDCFQEVDPVRQIKDIIQKLFSRADFLKEQTKKDCNWLTQFQELYDKIQEILQKNDILKQDKTYYDGIICKIFKGRLELANEAYVLKEYKLTEELCSQYIKQYSDKSESTVYLARAKARYFLKFFEKAWEDLEQYSKSTNKNAKYYIFRALVAVELNDYMSAAIAIYGIACAAKNAIKRLLNRKKIFELLPAKHIDKTLTTLLEKAKNVKPDKEAEIFKEEYIAYLGLAAEANNANAQFILSQMLWENNIFQAEMWLAKSAANGHAEAQHKLAELYRKRIASKECKEVDRIYYFAQMKKLFKEAASSHEPSKKIMISFYEEIAKSYQTGEPLISSDKKRKTLESITDPKQELFFTIEPPFKLPSLEESSLDVHLDSRNPGKRVRIPDTTTQMAEQVEKAFDYDLKRNYAAANLTIIFANNDRTARLIRTIPISTSTHKFEKVNIGTLFNRFGEAKIKNDHTAILDTAQEMYKKCEKQILQPEKGLLDFIPETFEKKYNPYAHKHSEHALYQYLMTDSNFSELLDKFIQKHSDVFKKGCKVYGVIIDFYSNRSSCTDCKKITFSLQNHGALLSKIQQAFHAKGYVLLTKRRTGLLKEGKLHLLVRIRAGKKLENPSDLIADKNMIPSNKNLKVLNNQFFFHKIEKPVITKGDTQDKYLLFESGTGTPRSQF